MNCVILYLHYSLDWGKKLQTDDCPKFRVRREKRNTGCTPVRLFQTDVGGNRGRPLN